ncbi:ATP-binding protein [Streptomyces sp. NPDC090306]|uniref:ATP-binding protein n=1 Tax=unclassified Streptomyces TaxID=2593676 RepID=UPI0036E43E8B
MFVPLDQQTHGEPGVVAASVPAFSTRWAGADSARIGEARRAVAAFLADAAASGHRRPGERQLQDAQLIVSELVTNAIRHAPGPCGLRLELSPDGARLRIAVRDGSRQVPLVRPVDGSRVGGHGLRLVTALAGDVRVIRFETGKEVVADVPLTAPGH